MSKSLRYFSIALILTMTPITYGYGLEVDIDEIRTKRVEFINYTGPWKKTDPLNEIEAIGRILAKDVERDRVRFHMKYSIVRARSADEPEKFAADIFCIDKDAKVGHIDAVRRIISSYLSASYGYNPKESRVISLFLSYYNALHRSDIAYFSAKYKRAVMAHLKPSNAGISTRYWEWPGATRMLIPLTETPQKGKIDLIDVDELSEKKVIDEIKKEDRAIPERKEMVDLRERKLDTDKKELEKDKKKLDEEKEEAVKKKEEIKKREDELKKEKEEAKKIEDRDKKRDKEIEIEKKEQKLEQEKKEQQKKEEAIKKEEAVVKKKEETIRKREESIKEEKKQIEKDELKRDIKKEPEQARKKLEEKEKELDKREDKLREKELDKNIYAGKLYYLKVKDYLEGGHYNNELYMINASTRKIMFKSPVTNICGRRYDVFSGGIVVITHSGSHTSGHHLTLIDKDTLEAKIHGSDNVFWRSFIEIRDGYIYAITYDNGRHYLGRFDGNLKLVAKSKEEVNEDTFISFWDNYIYINRKDKTIIVLGKDDLGFIDVVKP